MANRDQFASLIKAKIKKYANNIKQDEVGRVISVGDGIALVTGLEKAMLNELVVFENGTKGMILNLEAETLGIVMLGKYSDIQENSIVKRTKEVVSVPVGDQLLGRVVDAIGQPIDGGKELDRKNIMPIEKIAPGVITRESVNAPLETGILSIDSMFPIGKGQRELIIGDRQTGKSTIAIDTILNQKGKDVKCVYVAIGQKRSSVVQIYDTLQKAGAMEYTTIVSSTAGELPALIYLAPYSGITIAEYWLSKGEDVLIVYDDLSKHAVSYRTISLLLRRPPGREAYPGDVFYLHSRLLERAGKLNKENGGGSITALPIIETQAGDISAYIPTNVISITDGQLFMNTSMFNAGQRPAIDPGLSVSRVGSAAQRGYIKQSASSLKLELAQFAELSAFSQFGSDLDKETKQVIEHGERIMAMIKQPENAPYSQIEEGVLLFAIKHHYIKWIPMDKIDDFKKKLVHHFKPLSIMRELSKAGKYDDALTNKFHKEFKDFVGSYIKTIPNYKSEQYGDIKELN